MITIEAETADNKTKVTSIAIVEKGQTGKYGKVEEVPEPHRAKVQHLLQLLDSTDFRRSGLRLVPQVGEPDVRFELLLPQSTPALLNIEVKPSYRAAKATVECATRRERCEGSVLPRSRQQIGPRCA